MGTNKRENHFLKNFDKNYFQRQKIYLNYQN